MRANELRLGNWVFDQDCEPYYFQVEQIRRCIGNDLWVFYRDGSIKCKSPDPIPLTEEILLKCGFKKKEGLFVFNNAVIWSKNDMFNYEGLKYIKHIHQLQNLYFALTDQELNIEL